MTDLFQRLMTEATQLTHAGQLQAATLAIQRALRGDAPEVFGTKDTATAPVASPAAPTPKSGRAGAFLERLKGFMGRKFKPGGSNPAFLSPEVGVEADIHYVGPSPAVPGLDGEQWIDGSFTHQGRTLAYKLYVPPPVAGATPTPARPLVLMLHGCTQGAADFAAGTQMNTLARELGVLVLYPEQTQHANAQKCWNWFKPQHQHRGRGEPAVLAALTQSVTAKFNVDAARVYVAGLSAGGAMADIVGRCYPDIFAAVGVHSGLPSGAASDVMSALSVMRSGGAASQRVDAEVPPVIVFHGDADHTVHASNGDAIVEAARRGAGGSSARDVPAPCIVQGRSAKGQRYTRTVHEAEPGRSSAEYWQLHGAGHAWSGGSATGSYTNPAGADASAEMLRFFLAHPNARVADLDCARRA